MWQISVHKQQVPEEQIMITEKPRCQREAELICPVASPSPKGWVTDLSVELWSCAWPLEESLWAPEETTPCSHD